MTSSTTLVFLKNLTFDGFQTQVGKNTRFNNMNRYRINHHISALRQPNENPDEGAIREIKRRFNRITERKHVPKQIWDYLAVWICKTGSLSVSSSQYSRGQMAFEIIMGGTPDISEYLDFGFYD